MKYFLRKWVPTRSRTLTKTGNETEAILIHLYFTMWLCDNESWQNESEHRETSKLTWFLGSYHGTQVKNKDPSCRLCRPNPGLTSSSSELLDESVSPSLSVLICGMRVAEPVAGLLWGWYEPAQVVAVQQRLVIFIITPVSNLSSLSVLFHFHVRIFANAVFFCLDCFLFPP